jgi:hypothetical protein
MFKFSSAEVFLFLQPIVFVLMMYVKCGAPEHKWLKQPKMNDCLTLEDEGTMIFQNIRNHSPNDTMSHSRILNPQQHHCETIKSCAAERLLDIPINWFY